MRIGLVSPYSFDIPGGVGLHVRDLAEYLIADGHDVSVLAPADGVEALPPYVVSTGKPVPIKYNGSVARLAFGPVTAARVRAWLERGDFDVLHVHEPVSPSVSMLALWNYVGPIVATFHTSNVRSRVMLAAGPIMRPGLEKITGRIAVSEAARDTVRTHLGGDAVILPNGVYVDTFAKATPNPAWQGTVDAPTVAFLGRINEPRKGLSVLFDAMPAVLKQHPGARLLVAGPGDQSEAERDIPAATRRSVEFLGRVSDDDKARLLRSVDAYIAPNTGGESFGIILVEAMSAGAPVVASNLVAFDRVLGGGRAGRLFDTGDANSLARTLIPVLNDPAERRRMSIHGRERAQLYDWSTVARRILAVYETAIEVRGDGPRRWSPWRGSA